MGRQDVAIYGLCEPGTSAVRYVGKTRQSLGRRLAEHLSEAASAPAYVRKVVRLAQSQMQTMCQSREAICRSDEGGGTMLIDDLTHAKWVPARWRAVLQNATVFEISDVADYARATWWERSGPLEAPPNCAPLGPIVWLEWSRGILPEGARQVGVLLTTYWDTQEEPLPADADPSIPAQTRWICMGLTAYRNDRATAMLRDAVRFCLDGQGALRDVALLPIEDDGSAPDRQAVAQYQGCSYLALTAVCFAHCKGVTVTDHEQPRQQRRAAEREGRPPLVTYKTIDVAPVRRILHDEGDVEGVGLKRALHIARGHFAHYTQDAPMFGKYTGTFYRPMHVRGTAERGVVAKDYRVLATEEQRRTVAP